ncbi:hypothetical protein [Streptomyces sp. NPDC058424]
MEGIEAVLAEKFANLLQQLDERWGRLVQGYDGIRLVARAVGADLV